MHKISFFGAYFLILEGYFEIKEIAVSVDKKGCNIGNRKSLLSRFFGLFQLREQNQLLPDLVDDLEQAWREWRHARLYFNIVTDPDLIDYAIFNMGATEKKYIYLLKQARETGINVEDFEYGFCGRVHGKALV